MFVLERLIDIACRRHGFDRLDLRRRNLVPPEAMPYRNPLGLVYDSGDYPASLRRAAELGDWAGFAARRAEAQRARPLSRHRHRCLDRAEYRRPARARRVDDRPVGHGRDRARHDVGRPGSRNELRPDRQRMARRAIPSRSGWSPAIPTGCRPAAARPRRARCGSGRGLSRRRPTRSSRRAAASPPRCSKPPRPTSNFRRGAVSS